MLKKIMTAILSVVITLSLLNGTGVVLLPVMAEETETALWEGEGTEESPWLLSDAEDLVELSDSVREGNSHSAEFFRMTRDIDLSTVCGASGFTEDGVYDGISKYKKSWSPIGYCYYDLSSRKNVYGAFEGNFDGDGHTVSNLYINESVLSRALFGYIADCIIENLTVGGYVNAQSMNASGIVSDASGTVVLRNCVNHADVYGRSCSGIVDQKSSQSGTSLYLTVTGCSNYGKIGDLGSSGFKAGISCAGGTISISDCANYGNISSSASAYGIAGSGTVNGCANFGDVTVSSADANGIGGTEISNCYNMGSITSSRNNSDYGYLAAGISVSAKNGISNCYNTGKISSVSSGVSAVIPCGGNFPITYNAQAENCYYLEGCTAVEAQEGYPFAGTSKTSDELKALADDLGDYFFGDTAGINNGYPVLKWQAEAEKHTVTFELETVVDTVKMYVNGKEISSGSSLVFPEGNTAKISFDNYNTGLYKVGSVTTSYDKDIAEDADGSFSLLVTEDCTVKIYIVEMDKGSTGFGDGENLYAGEINVSSVWDGETIDVSWYFGHEEDDSYEISAASQLEGVAALVNGIVDNNLKLYYTDNDYYTSEEWNARYAYVSEGTTGGNNLATTTYHWGIEDFCEKTIKLTANVDMGGVYDKESDTWSGPNYMPIGGQYLAVKNDSSTKLSSSFNGTFDGTGHYVFNIFCDRHCETGNYGDGASVGGIIGRLGVHDNDPWTEEISVEEGLNRSWRPTEPAVKNVGVTGFIYGNRHVGGIVGKTGKTSRNNGDGSYGAIIENCVNYARVVGTDAKGTGGIVGAGWNGGIIRNCYNLGRITGGWPAGGIVGSNEIEVVNCYSARYVDSKAGDRYGESIGTNNGGAPWNIIQNCWCLTNSSTDGGYYDSGKTYNDTAMSENDMKTAAFAGTMGSRFTADSQGISYGYPVLLWQAQAGVGSYEVTFATDPEAASVKVFADSDMQEEISGTEGFYVLEAGVYYYRVSANGYFTEEGSFNVVDEDKEISVKLTPAHEVTFSVEPSGAVVYLTLDEAEVKPESTSAGEYVYILKEGYTYNYTVYADGYTTIQKDYTVPKKDTNIVVSLQKPEEDDKKYIYGDGNVGYNHKITEGGTYYIGSGAKGIVNIKTDEPVTLIGAGADLAYVNLYIDCTEQSTDLTLQDVYISNTIAKTNMINYYGEDNYLRFSGVCILDQDTNATGYAMIHVNEETSLTVTGNIAYLYKREQGAGIGGNGGADGDMSDGSVGQAQEYNGDITIDGAMFYMKGSKQGAVIGSGAQANNVASEPGDIVIKNSTLVLLGNARGAVIGGSAGSGGAASGTDVYVINSNLTINIDFSGSAIGGGGYAEGNDSGGGILHYTSGSIRTFIDYNAVDPEGDGLENNTDNLWKDFGVSEPGVNNNASITAGVQNLDGEELALLTLDTAGVAADDGTYTVTEDGTEIYKGGLHEYAYVNEALHKSKQIAINNTIDNWGPLDDPNLYLYLTGEDHFLDVNGVLFDVQWDEDNKQFNVSEIDEPEYDPGDVNLNETVNIIDAQIAYDIAIGQYAYMMNSESREEQIEYMLLQRRADVNKDGDVTALDARAIQYYVHNGKFGEE